MRSKWLGALGALAALALSSVSASAALAATTAHANLAVQLSGPRSVQLGDRVSYTATVRDVGGADASLAVLKYDVPTKAGDVSLSASQGACGTAATPPNTPTSTTSNTTTTTSTTSNTPTTTTGSSTPNAPTTGTSSSITCELGTIAHGQSATVTITLTAKQAGYMQNRVWVSSGLPDQRRFDNHANVVTFVRGTPTPPATGAHTNLSLQLVGPRHAKVGEQVTYTATILNRGPNDAPQVALRDVVSFKVAVVSATGSQGSCTQSGRTIDCELGTLGVGKSATVTIVATAGQRGYMLDHAWTASGLPDRRQFNNHRAVLTFVRVAAQPAPRPAAHANLSLHLEGPSRVHVGDRLTYVATIRNLGPATAHVVVLRNVLPDRVSFVSASPTQGTCTAGRVVRCDLHELADGATATVTIVADAHRAGDAVDHARVESNRADQRRFNNWRAVVTHVARSSAANTPTSTSANSVSSGSGNAAGSHKAHHKHHRANG